MPRGIPNAPRTPGETKPKADEQPQTLSSAVPPSEAGAVDTSGANPTTVANQIAESMARAEQKQAKATEPLEGDLAEQLAAERAKNKDMRSELDDLKAQFGAFARIAAVNAQANAPKQPVTAKLPTMAEAMADAEKRVAEGLPVHPVLTDEGHYVHPLSGFQPERGANLSIKDMQKLAATLVAAQQAASVNASALSRARTEDMMAEGRPEKAEA